MSKNEINKAISNIVDSIYLITKVENCYGEIRFHIVSGQLVEPTIAMKIYEALSLILIIIGYLFLILCPWFDIKLDFFYFDVKNSKFVKETLMAVYILQYGTALAKFLRNDKENIKIIISLAHIDCSLNVSNNRGFYEKRRKCNQIIICVFLIMLIANIVKHFIQNNSTLTYVIIYNVIDALADYKFDLETLVFYVYIKLLSERLDILNDYLKEFVQYKNKSRSLIIYQDFNISDHGGYIGNISQQNTKIASLAAIYENIGETLSLINSLFAGQIFMYLTATFMYVILTLWSCVNFIRSKKHFTFSLGVMCECVVAISVVVFMCYICESLTSKRQSTKILVSEIVMDYKLPKEMRIQAKAFMNLIDVWSLQVYACNMFCLNIQLPITFVGLITSYLIVIMQATN